MADERAAVDRSGGLALILTTAPDAGAAERIVRTLVEERLIACGNLLPDVLSLYRCEGRIARESEVLVLLKSSAGTIDALFDRLPQLHPYEVPELVEIPIATVSAGYRRWVIESTEVSA